MSFPINSAIPRVQYTASSMQTTFIYPWPIFTNQDLSVFRNFALLVVNVDYTVTGVDNGTGGTIVLIIPSTAGDRITIQRTIEIARTTNYNNGTAINADDLNNDFNKLTAISQDLNAYIQKVMPKYLTAELISETRLQLPLLPPGYIWQGGLDGTIVPALIDESFDASTLRSELAVNATNMSAGANLSGYYDTNSSTPMTVNDKLNLLTGQITQNILSILDFGADPTGATDTTPAYNSALSYFAANDTAGLLWFPKGFYKFSTQPDKVTLPLHIFGDGIGLTVIYKDYVGVGAEGLIHFYGIDGATEAMSFIAIDSSSGGSMLSFTDNGLDGASNFPQIINISVTCQPGGASYDYGVVIDNSGLLEICQNPTIENVNVVDATTASFYIQGSRNGIYNVACGDSGGNVANFLMLGTLGLESINNDVTIRAATDISINYCDYTVFKCASVTNFNNTATCNFISVYGNVTNRQNNFISSRYIGALDFRSLLTGNGYQYLPGGLIAQWVTVQGIGYGTTSLAIALPISFPAVNLGIFGSFGFGAPSDASAYLTGSTNSSFTIHKTFTTIINQTFLLLGY